MDIVFFYRFQRIRFYLNLLPNIIKGQLGMQFISIREVLLSKSQQDLKPLILVVNDGEFGYVWLLMARSSIFFEPDVLYFIVEDAVMDKLPFVLMFGRRLLFFMHEVGEIDIRCDKKDRKESWDMVIYLIFPIG